MKVSNYFMTGFGTMITAVCFVLVNISSASISQVRQFRNQPLFFVQNNGQVDKAVKFYEKSPDHTTYFTENSVYLTIFKHSEKPTQYSLPESEIVELKITGANHHPKIKAAEEHKTKLNYFIGNDPAKWLRSVPTYKAVHYTGIYDEIDLCFYGNNRALEYDVIVNPGGDPGQVAFHMEGARSLEINEKGELLIHLSQGSLKQKTPYVYQMYDGKQVEIPGAFRLIGKNSYTFTIGAYDTSRQLIIDPVIVYSDVFGGNGTDYSNAIAIDSAGNAYMTGYTESSTFPSPSYPRNNTAYYYDAFVYKVNAGGSMDYVTVFGGTAIDWISGATREAGNGIAVDSQGRAHIVGSTMSVNFPTTTGAVQSSLGGSQIQAHPDAFYAVFDTSGEIIYSTYLGGSNIDRGMSIAVDALDDAYLAGMTAPFHYSIPSDFPVSNALQPAYGGDNNISDSIYPADGFITKFDFDPANPANTAIVFSTYFGGNYIDYINGIDVDAQGNIYVTGGTQSASFPGTSLSQIQSTSAGSTDAFVSKINHAGNSIVYSTYIGGPRPDYGNAIDVDANGAAYIIGTIDSPLPNYNEYFPLHYAIQTASQGEKVAFVTKINADGTDIDYSTFLGGSASDQGRNIAVDSSGSAYVVGSTRSEDFPVVNPINGHAAMLGSGDGFLARLTPLGSRLIYSTFLGGDSGSDIYAEPGFDHILGVSVDNSGNAYLTGVTNSRCFPAPESGSGPACDIDYYGLMDAFVAKIYDNSPIPPEIISTSPIDGSTEISVDTVVSATFSEEMNTGTFGGNFLLYTAGTPVPGTAGSAGNDLITFIPSSPLLHNTTYNATVTTGVRDADGTFMFSDYNWSFTTEPPPADDIAPTITAHTPPDFYSGGNNLEPLDTVFTVTFSENIAPATLNTDSFFAEIYNSETYTFDRLSGSFSYDQNTLTATFTPDDDLPYQESIFIKVTQDVTDPAGNTLYVEPPDWWLPEFGNYTDPYGWEIMTICNPEAPLIASSDPVMWSTSAPTDTNITITFDKEMDPATMISDNFSFYELPSYTPIPGEVTGYDAAARMVTFAPAAALSTETIYVLIFNFISDTEGIGYCTMNGNSVYFTTAAANQCSPDATPPVITLPENITLDCSGLGGTPVNLAPPAVTDTCDPGPVLTNDAPALFPIGTTTVTWTALDATGNSATAGQEVTIVDPDNLCSGSLELESSYNESPPDIDGIMNFGEWPEETSNQFNLENGFIRITHDRTRLYILIDLLADDGDDIGTPRDFFNLSFDVGNDGLITSDKDINYTLFPDVANIRYQFYTGPGSWSGWQAETFSSMARGFDCFVSDQSKTYTDMQIDTCEQHRIWELAIDLKEMSVETGNSIGMGIQVVSPFPALNENIPLNFTNDFSNLIKIHLASTPPIIDDVASGDVTLTSEPLEITQGIQDLQNSLPLVQDKETAARIYAVGDIGAVLPTLSLVSLYAQKEGIDLPGSPFTVFHRAPLEVDRENLSDSVNFKLPRSWTQGNVDFQAVVRGVKSDDLGDSSAAVPISFIQKEIPVYWHIRLNTGTEDVPEFAPVTDIQTAESYLKTIYPVPDVKFVRKQWQSVGSVTTDSDDAIADLNDYYSSVFMGWSMGVMATGSAPFALPDQIFGISAAGLSIPSTGKSYGGMSDPTWFGGLGIVSWGVGSSVTHDGVMAHEIVHNLDKAPLERDPTTQELLSGTWGRHVAVCGAGGHDPEWPYADGTIQEVGFDTRLPWIEPDSDRRTIVPAATVGDLMTYCQASISPVRWISPYRWMALFNYLPAIEAEGGMLAASGHDVPAVSDMYYIDGSLNIYGDGQLDPITTAPGDQSFPLDIDGKYSVTLLDSSGGILELSTFNMAFLDEDLDPVEKKKFHFRMPVVQGQTVSSVVLANDAVIIDQIDVSANPPQVTLLSPDGGDSWSGSGTVIWHASDDDTGDTLTFSLFYSPDDGVVWIPVAQNLVTESYTIDTGSIPGGTTSRIRVIATDGFHTAMDDSDATFSVEQNPPSVSITAPVSGNIFQVGTKVLLKGNATDPEDDTLADTSVIWFLNDGAVANGRTAEILLPVGQQTLTLRAIDSAGAIGEDSVLIEIVPCPGGYDQDNDVDGLDIFFQATGQTKVTLTDFAENFGKTSCD